VCTILRQRKTPDPSLENLTVPLGVLVGPASVSLTVAAQVVEPPTATDPGEHETVVALERAGTVKQVEN
jgi:hypothetical protein